MITLVVGGSGSGKSEYAENLLCSYGEGRSRIYIATMEVYGEEGRNRVKKHLEKRAGKNFITVEKTTNLSELVGSGKLCNPPFDMIIECVSNLVANEMFSETKSISKSVSDFSVDDENELARQLAADIIKLCGCADNTVIVTNNIFEDGNTYDAETAIYISVLGRVNSILLEKADDAYEIVVGIPVTLKEKER